MAETFQQFEQFVMDSGVSMGGDVLRVADVGESDTAFSYEPGPMYAAIVQAGLKLRRQPNEPLLTHGLLPTTESPDQPRSVAWRTLVRMLNASVVPETGPPDRLFSGREGQRAIGGCEETEMYFSELIADMVETVEASERGETRLMKFGCQLILGANGRAIAVRKGPLVEDGLSHGEPSTLALEGLWVNNKYCPPGSLLRMELTRDRTEMKDQDWEYETDVPAGKQEFVPYDEVGDVGFVRLTCLALPPDQREADFPESFTQPSEWLTDDLLRQIERQNHTLLLPMERISEVAYLAVRASANQSISSAA